VTDKDVSTHGGSFAPGIALCEGDCLYNYIVLKGPTNRRYLHKSDRPGGLMLAVTYLGAGLMELAAHG
jgi:hypothetical protein